MRLTDRSRAFIWWYKAHTTFGRSSDLNTKRKLRTPSSSWWSLEMKCLMEQATEKRNESSRQFSNTQSEGHMAVSALVVSIIRSGSKLWEDTTRCWMEVARFSVNCEQSEFSEQNRTTSRRFSGFRCTCYGITVEQLQSVLKYSSYLLAKMR
ncbi:Hypothetical_protein [Hexamita inflata]|uniref:Hypothetical_protein n=1 Tax=Hexamita inflata TaxID=28002 RepID=A0AA86U593_9EUKA|nr:Hypothetical protein HINF_LOCUS29069 [Hexamita inflata]